MLYDGVTFLNRFTVHAGPAEFEQAFAATAEFMVGQAGFLGNTLLRHAEDRQTYVNIAHWQDVESFRGAIEHPAFAPHARALRGLSRSEPNLYVPRQTFWARSGPDGKV